MSRLLHLVVAAALLPQVAVAGTVSEAQFENYEHDTGDLDAKDLRYLNRHKVYIPTNMSAAQRAGAHSVINDPSLQANPALRLSSVNDYLDLVVAQNLACKLDPNSPALHCELTLPTPSR